MSYTALYRKYRPSEFDDVKGQDHIVKTLKNQIVNGRTGHAYIFCGTRGTGKTTIAKIFAKAVNCQNTKDGTPCGECASCKAIASGSSMNVVEIDAASNNGVENVRNIIEEVQYSPVDGKYKVYIIDEVHMLTKEAFNALLKTLEEPPEYAKFIMATTEVHRIPITVLSRCQRYDFKRIGIDTISDRMQELINSENVQVEDRALRYIARAADGSMRDALSLLDQCIAFNYGKELTYDMALDILGAVDTTVFSELLRLIADDDILGQVDLLEKIILQGRELGQFVTDFTWYLRNLMLIMSSDNDKIEEILEMSTENVARLRQEAEMFDLNAVFRYITVFSELSGKLKFASQKRILVEMTLIKLCRPQMGVESEDVLDRIRKIEDRLEKGDFVVQSQNIKKEVSADSIVPRPEIIPDALPEDIKRVGTSWGAIISKTGGLLCAALKRSHLSVNKDQTMVYICVDDPQNEKLANKPDKREELENAFIEVVGKKVPFEIRCYNREQDFDDQFADLVKSLGAIVEDE